MRAQRAALGAATLGLARSHLLACLAAFSPYVEATVLVAYLAIGHEVPTDALIADALRRGKRVYVPRVGARWFHRYEPTVGLRDGSAGVPEPDSGEALEPGERSGIVLVPLLAWTARGDRLGRGGGWYDRVLPLLAMPRVGLAYDFQERVHVPTEPSDVRLDYVVTESRMIDCGTRVLSERRLS